MALETLQHSVQGDRNQTDHELEVLRLEMASVEQSLSVLQKKNRSLRAIYEEKQKNVAEQRKVIDQRKTQIDSVSQKVSCSDYYRLARKPD